MQSWGLNCDGMEIILGTLFYVVMMKGQAAVIVFDIRRDIYQE